MEEKRFKFRGKKKKSAPKLKKKSSMYYLNPRHMIEEIKEYDRDEYNKYGDVGFIGMFFAIEFFTAFAFALQPLYFIAFMLLGALFLPHLLVIKHKNKYEEKRFYEANAYMEQVLHSFKKSKKYLTALYDIRPQFKGTEMGEDIDVAIDHITNECDQDANPVKEAMDMLEEKYSCNKIHTIHQFMFKAESLGGDFENTVNLMLEDRSAWEGRVNKLQQMKNSKKALVVASIVMTVLICLFFIRLPMMMNELKNLSIAHNFIVEIGTLIMWVLDVMLYTKTEKKLSDDWLNDRYASKPGDAKRRYNKVVNYNLRKERDKSLKFAILPGIFTVLGIVLGKPLIIIPCAIITVFMLFQHRVDYSLAKKAVIREINLTFPQWLMELALLLQSESSQRAIQISYATAPAVLQPALEKMIHDMYEDPKSPDPYNNFLKEFDLKQVQSAMKMLYSIAAGTGGSPDQQIADIIRRNIAMLEVVEQQENENKMGSMLLLFLAPQLVGSGKMLVDMMIFFLVSLSNIGKMM